MELQTTWGALAQAAGGTLLRGAPRRPAARIATDSRTLRRGEVFLALKGPRFDAHALLDGRLAREASGWIVRRGAGLPQALPAHVLEVPDTLRALSDIAAAHRARFHVPVAGVTGSNGKTTVKEMLRSILSERGPVCANAGNFNNEVGLPLSVLDLGPEHAFGVFEMGASHPGDIAALCRVARPTIGVITNIGSAHLEFFGTLEATLRAKAELLDSLPADSPAVLNLDDARLASLLPRLGARALTFGAKEGADVRLECSPGSLRLVFSGRGSLPRGVLEPRLALSSRIHGLNAAAAAAAAAALGLGKDAIRAGLERTRGAPLRFQRRDHPSGAWFLIDAYNANPDSMRASVETFLQAAPRGERILVLGDMRELGPSSPRLHRELGRWLASLDLKAVFLAGDLAGDISAGLREARAPFEVRHAAGPMDLLAELRPRLGKGASVLFKASRAVRLEELAEAL